MEKEVVEPSAEAAPGREARQYIPPNHACVLFHEGKGLYFHEIRGRGFAWMPIEHATVLPRRKWMVAEGERLIPVRLMPVPVSLEVERSDAPESPRGPNPDSNPPVTGGV